MHLNPIRPNILRDMQAAANGRDLRKKDNYGYALAMRHLIPHKSYPYASERQVKRQQNKFEVLVNRALASIKIAED